MTAELYLPLRCLGLGYHKIDRLDGVRLQICGLAKYHAGGWVLTELGADILGEMKRGDPRTG
jgi:hypothetical protein